MATEELSVQLHQKMAAEQARYRTELLTLTPGEILEHAAEYAIREYILVATEHQKIHDDRAKALLSLENPLAAVYGHHEKYGVSCLRDVWNSVIGKANAVMRQNAVKNHHERQ